jgi:three-Cys-motif partner protein
MANNTMQLFGGDWTEQKLKMLKQYLERYTTVLKKQKFLLMYIDAFAGTGYRQLKEGPAVQRLLFGEIAEEEPQQFLDGSARIALKAPLAFSRYVFIEMDKQRFGELEKLKAEFPERADSIVLRQGNANDWLQQYSAQVDWKVWRAVLFLDPFGMQIDWATMEAIAKTKAIDVWILFPLGMAVNRLLTKDPAKIPQVWRNRLNRMFGSEDWFDTFYMEEVSPNLLGEDKRVQKVGTIETISGYYRQKLMGVFPKVAVNPRILRNSMNAPLFQMFFAAANPGRGGDIAIKIAQHILKEKEP